MKYWGSQHPRVEHGPLTNIIDTNERQRYHYTLTYTTAAGARESVRNLQSTGADHVEAAQRQLGSTDFWRLLQPHCYSQQELDLIERTNKERP
jgi:hypothetical protein